MLAGGAPWPAEMHTTASAVCAALCVCLAVADCDQSGNVSVAAASGPCARLEAFQRAWAEDVPEDGWEAHLAQWDPRKLSTSDFQGCDIMQNSLQTADTSGGAGKSLFTGSAGERAAGLASCPQLHPTHPPDPPRLPSMARRSDVSDLAKTGSF